MELLQHCKFDTFSLNKDFWNKALWKKRQYQVTPAYRFYMWRSDVKTFRSALLSCCAFSAGIALGVIHADHASAADLVIPIEQPVTVEDRMQPEWEATIAPFYTWLPGIHGTMGVRGVNADVSFTAWDLIESIDEVLHALDGIYFGSGHIRQGNFGLFYDISYLDLSSSADFAGSGAYDLGRLEIPIEVDGVADASFKYSSYTLAGTYRFYETTETQLDAMLGARLTDVDIELAVTGNVGVVLPGGDVIPVAGGTASVGQEAHWWDAVAGMSGRHNFTPNWYVNGWALIGAGESDYVYDVMGGIGYEWSNGWGLFGGWRVVGTDYSDDGFTYDNIMSGPVTGLSVRF
jgi:hypothetical protein